MLNVIPCTKPILLRRGPMFFRLRRLRTAITFEGFARLMNFSGHGAPAGGKERDNVTKRSSLGVLGRTGQYSPRQGAHLSIAAQKGHTAKRPVGLTETRYRVKRNKDAHKATKRRLQAPGSVSEPAHQERNQSRTIGRTEPDRHRPGAVSLPLDDAKQIR